MIQVNEIFGPTVQGEGKSAGMPVAFMRLANCNLHCFKCDTPHTWNWVGSKWAHPEKYEKSKEIHQMEESAIFTELLKTQMKALVISGGEPFMQQKQLMDLLQILKANNWWVEVETNGTIVPNSDFVSLVNQINCSPKLDNSFSGDPLKLRIKPAALEALAALPKVNFKFVVEDERDMAEVVALVERFQMKEVRLMPECRTRKELLAKELLLKRLCEKYGMIYCTRLSILQSGTKRGV